VNAGKPGAFAGPCVIGEIIEEADVLQDRTGQELIVLHHSRDLAPIGPHAEGRHRQAVDPNLPVRRLEKPSMILIRVVLPHPEGPVMAILSPASTRSDKSLSTKGSASE